MKSSDTPESQPRQTLSQPTSHSVPVKKILVADDIAMNRELMRDMLESSGYLVMEACDGGEAIREAYSTSRI